MAPTLGNVAPEAARDGRNKMDVVTDLTALLDEAKGALDRRDYESAIGAADRAIQADARAAKAWRLKLGALRKAGKAELAEEASLEAMRLFPEADWAMTENAFAAAARDDIEEAMTRFARLRNRFSGSAAGYTGAIKLALKSSKPALAESLLADGMRRLPNNKQLDRLRQELVTQESAALDGRSAVVGAENPKAALAEIIRIARRESRRNVNRALALSMLDTFHETYPDFAPAYASHVEILSQVNRSSDAAVLAESARDRFPDHIGIGVAAIKAYARDGDLDRALSLVSRLTEQFSDAAAVQGARIHVLANAGRDDEAEMVAETALSTWPSDIGLWREYARIATRRGEWAVALDRWLQAQRQRPDDKSLARQIRVAQAQVCVSAPAQDTGTVVYDRFESLGGDPLGCEFGMVQRDGGSESVGLLRWAAITLDDLIDALNSDFEGLGSEAQTRLTEVSKYYGLRDLRYGLFTHTFVKREDAPHDKMLLQSCRRMRFLADKLREELGSGERIFVYKSAAVLPDEQLFRLHDAIVRHGGRSLLCLQRATERQPAGSVRSVRPGVFAGHLAYFMSAEPVANQARFDVASYDAICTAVAALTARTPSAT